MQNELMERDTSGFPDDLARKVAKARDMRGEGLRFIVCLTSCPSGWGAQDHEAVELARLAVDTGLFPLYEVDHGTYVINRGPQGVSVPHGWAPAPATLCRYVMEAGAR